MRKPRVSRTSKSLRENPLFVRNEYNGECPWDIPVVKACHISAPEIQFLSYQNTKMSDRKNVDKAVHFFVDDYHFECVYKNPDRYVRKLAQYKYVLTPDFSLLADMPLWLQYYNVARNRWCGRYWQDLTLPPVIPSVSWSTPVSYSFAFLGLERGTTVAVSTVSVMRSKEKKLFLLGYDEMVSQIAPDVVYCYGKPFPEMKGNVISVDYLLTTRRAS